MTTYQNKPDELALPETHFAITGTTIKSTNIVVTHEPGGTPHDHVVFIVETAGQAFDGEHAITDTGPGPTLTMEVATAIELFHGLENSMKAVAMAKMIASLPDQFKEMIRKDMDNDGK